MVGQHMKRDMNGLIPMVSDAPPTATLGKTNGLPHQNMVVT
jgi:hypothetical protein